MLKSFLFSIFYFTVYHRRRHNRRRDNPRRSSSMAFNPAGVAAQPRPRIFACVKHGLNFFHFFQNLSDIFLFCDILKSPCDLNPVFSIHLHSLYKIICLHFQQTFFSLYLENPKEVCSFLFPSSFCRCVSASFLHAARTDASSLSVCIRV